MWLMNWVIVRTKGSSCFQRPYYWVLFTCIFLLSTTEGITSTSLLMKIPATSRKDESVYGFWFRSVSQSWINAWKLEAKRLHSAGFSSYSIKNEMLVFQLIQICYIVLIGLMFSWSIAALAILIAMIGFLLLETVNYIEHYGLRRKKMANGRYEPVRPFHSWNSNHPTRPYIFIWVDQAFRSSL